MNRHPDTFIELDRLGEAYPPYQPTFEFDGPYVHASQAELARCRLLDGALVQLEAVEGSGRIIPGWLRLDDALKLYELAYFARGDILELGSYHGLSTTILSRANHDSPWPKRIETIDLEAQCAVATRLTLAEVGLARDVHVNCGDALVLIKDLASEGRRFAFAFIDHSHEYRPVLDVCRQLAHVIEPGGFCLFHDYNDVRNRDPNDTDYGVYQAVVEGLPEEFEFWGVYGCAGLYRRRQ